MISVPARSNCSPRRRLELPRDGCSQPDDARSLAPDRHGGDDRLHGTHSWRDRNRQGARRKGRARAERAAGRVVRDAELLGHPLHAARERALRTREGRVYGRGDPADGRFGARAKRNVVPRRGWRAEARLSAEATPLAPRARIRAARQQPDAPRRRPPRRRHAPRISARCAKMVVPRGPLFTASRSSRSSCRPCASAARTSPSWCATSFPCSQSA